MIEVGQWIQYGALGGVLLVVWAFFQKLLPALLKTFTEELRADRVAQLKKMEAIEKSIKENSMVLARLSALLISHDATVRGVNPEVMGTTEELVERILAQN